MHYKITHMVMLTLFALSGVLTIYLSSNNVGDLDKYACTIINSIKFHSIPVPQIVIMGPPASGKRTIAKMVCNKLRAAHLTPDNLITEADPELKAEAQPFIEKNQVKSCSTGHNEGL